MWLSDVGNMIMNQTCMQWLASPYFFWEWIHLFISIYTHSNTFNLTLFIRHTFQTTLSFNIIKQLQTKQNKKEATDLKRMQHINRESRIRRQTSHSDSSGCCRDLSDEAVFQTGHRQAVLSAHKYVVKQQPQLFSSLLKTMTDFMLNTPLDASLTRRKTAQMIIQMTSLR